MLQMRKGVPRCLTGHGLRILTGGDLVEPCTTFHLLETGRQGLEAFDQGTDIIALVIDCLKTSPYYRQDYVNMDDIGCQCNHDQMLIIRRMGRNLCAEMDTYYIMDSNQTNPRDKKVCRKHNQAGSGIGLVRSPIDKMSVDPRIHMIQQLLHSPWSGAVNRANHRGRGRPNEHIMWKTSWSPRLWGTAHIPT
jgi:hypothetical protein